MDLFNIVEQFHIIISSYESATLCLLSFFFSSKNLDCCHWRRGEDKLDQWTSWGSSIRFLDCPKSHLEGTSFCILLLFCDFVYPLYWDFITVYIFSFSFIIHPVENKCDKTQQTMTDFFGNSNGTVDYQYRLHWGPDGPALV